jgi:hypothetical protein
VTLLSAAFSIPIPKDITHEVKTMANHNFGDRPGMVSRPGSDRDRNDTIDVSAYDPHIRGIIIEVEQCRELAIKVLSKTIADKNKLDLTVVEKSVKARFYYLSST